MIDYGGMLVCWFIIPLYPIKGQRIIGPKKWIWKYPARKMVSVESTILLITTVVIVQGKIPW